MDKEDWIHALLSTLQKPHWKRSSSVTDWDLKKVLWAAGCLTTPDQIAALLSDMKRRGLIVARDRRVDDRAVAMWGVRITPAGEDWLLQRAISAAGNGRRPPPPGPAPVEAAAESLDIFTETDASFQA